MICSAILRRLLEGNIGYEILKLRLLEGNIIYKGEFKDDQFHGKGIQYEPKNPKLIK